MMPRYTRRGLFQFAGAAGAACMLEGLAGCTRNRIQGEGTEHPPVGAMTTSRPQGPVPLIAVEGTAYDCGHSYGELVLQRYPGYRRYLDMLGPWQSLSPLAKRLFEQRAPYVPEVYRGLIAAAGLPASRHAASLSSEGAGSACTSFGVAGSVTVDGHPISGQTKDTIIDSAELYIVLRMRIAGGPTILVLAYPGEILGYGLWSTGMSLFRNSLNSRGGEGQGLPMEQWGLLALAGTSVDEGAELALKYGMSTIANCLISDAAGRSVNVESNAGGISIVSGQDGITTHANHPTGEKTSGHEDYPDAFEKDFSRWRAKHLWGLLHTERGRLTAAKAMACLADHSRYPYGLCRHLVADSPRFCTTAGVVVEPTRGLLHVVRGNPCANRPTPYTV